MLIPGRKTQRRLFYNTFLNVRKTFWKRGENNWEKCDAVERDGIRVYIHIYSGPRSAEMERLNNNERYTGIPRYGGRYRKKLRPFYHAHRAILSSEENRK